EHLDGDGREGERIVAGQPGIVGVPEARRDDDREQQEPEDARPGLLRHEHRELDEPGAYPPQLGTVDESVRGAVDALLERRVARHDSSSADAVRARVRPANDLSGASWARAPGTPTPSDRR